MDFIIPVLRYFFKSLASDDFTPPEEDINWLIDQIDIKGNLCRVSVADENTIVFALVPELFFQGPDEDALSQEDIEESLMAIRGNNVNNGELCLLGGENRRLIARITDRDCSQQG